MGDVYEPDVGPRILQDIPQFHGEPRVEVRLWLVDDQDPASALNTRAATKRAAFSPSRIWFAVYSTSAPLTVLITYGFQSRQRRLRPGVNLIPQLLHTAEGRRLRLARGVAVLAIAADELLGGH